NSLAFVQRLVAVRLNRGEVDENIFARLPLDEPITLAGIKPLHCSLFFHFFCSLLYELFVALRPPPAVQQKGAASACSQPLPSNLKVLQERQTQKNNSIPKLSRQANFPRHRAASLTSDKTDMPIEFQLDNSGNLCSENAVFDVGRLFCWWREAR